MFAFNTDRKSQQYVENVDSLFASISHYYQLPYKESVEAGEYRLSFGSYPICEHNVCFSPFRGGRAELSLRIENDKFFKEVTGHTIDQLSKLINSKEIKKEEVNGFFKVFFDSEKVQVKIDDYGLPKATVIVSIEMIDNNTLDMISHLLKQTGLIPKSQSTRKYEL